MKTLARLSFTALLATVACDTDEADRFDPAEAHLALPDDPAAAAVELAGEVDPAAILPGFDLDIVAVGSDIALSWEDLGVDGYQVWRSSDPYFRPGDPGSTLLATVEGTTYLDGAAACTNCPNRYWIIRVAGSEASSTTVGAHVLTVFNGFNKVPVSLVVPGLDSSADLAPIAGAGFDAAYIWNRLQQSWVPWIPNAGISEFPIALGDAPVVRLSLATAPQSRVLTGYVPAPGELSLTLYPGDNIIALPLTHPAMLASEIDEVMDADAVARWHAGNQEIRWYTGDSEGPDFLIPSGGDLHLTLDQGGTWPFPVPEDDDDGYPDPDPGCSVHDFEGAQTIYPWTCGPQGCGDFGLYTSAPPAPDDTSAMEFPSTAFGTDGNRTVPYGALGSEAEQAQRETGWGEIPQTLTFWSWNVDEGGDPVVSSFDTKRIEITTNGTTWTTLVDCGQYASDPPEGAFEYDPRLPAFCRYVEDRDALDWDLIELDTSAWEGEQGRLRFSYDTVDGCCEFERGWYIDNLSFAQYCTEPPPPPPEVNCVQEFGTGVIGSAVPTLSSLGWTVTGDWTVHVQAPRAAAPGPYVTGTAPIPFGTFVLGNDGNRTAWYLTLEDLETEWWEVVLPSQLQEVETGIATSPVDVIPETIELDSWKLDNGEGLYTDIKVIEISVAGGPWTVLANCETPGLTAFCTTNASWVHMAIDTSAWAGQTGRIRFRYETVSPLQWWDRGWYIDNLNFAQTACDELGPDDLVFAQDDAFDVANDQTLAGDGLLDNDWAANGDPMIDDADTTTALGGTVTVDEDGSFSYTPPPSAWGTDTFSYTLGDGEGNVHEATVTIDVRAANFQLAQIGAGLDGIVLNPTVGLDNEMERPVIVGDVNGDGYDDIAWTTVSAGAGVQTVVLFGTSSAATIATPAQAAAGTGGFVVSGARWPRAVGDVNGDGRADILFGSANNAFDEVVVMFGKTDTAPAQLATIQAGTGGFAIDLDVDNGINSYTQQGFEAFGGGDFNGDGRNDVVFGAYQGDFGASANVGMTYIVFGKTSGTPVLLSTLSATGQGTVVHGPLSGGAQQCGAYEMFRDVDGDGYSDVWVACANTLTGWLVYGRPDADIVDIALDDGVVEPLDGGVIAYAVGDVDGDGLSDMRLGNAIVFGDAFDTTLTQANIAAGIGGVLLTGGSIGSAGHDGGNDVNGDGYSDFRVDLAGEAVIVFGRGGNAAINVAAAADGHGGMSFTPARQVGRSMAGDIDGDGYGDIVVGQRILFGDAFSGTPNLQGTPNADTRNGSSHDDIAVVGRGADNVGMGGGNDVVHGGAGNEIIVTVGTDFRLIDGGAGTDQLRLSYASPSVDLSELAGRVRNIEEVWTIQGATVYLHVTDIARLSETSNALRIYGLSDTTVIADLDGGAFTPMAIPPYIGEGVTNGTLSLSVEGGADLQIVN